jgi:hypothetical protein
MESRGEREQGRRGEREKGRKGLLFTAVKEPWIRIIYHCYQLSDNFIVRRIEINPLASFYILTFNRKLQPGLNFSSFTFAVRELTDKGCLITSFAPCFSQISTN